jgi:hypothetical protein
MPIYIKETEGGTGYGNPLVGPPGPFTHIKLDLSTLTTDEVDADGNLKPGCVFESNGTPVGSGQICYGIVTEPIALPITLPRTNTTLGNETADPLIAVCTSGLVNRDVAEDNLGRAYTADELAGFVIAGSNFSLTTT